MFNLATVEYVYKTAFTVDSYLQTALLSCYRYFRASSDSFTWRDLSGLLKMSFSGKPCPSICLVALIDSCQSRSIKEVFVKGRSFTLIQGDPVMLYFLNSYFIQWKISSSEACYRVSQSKLYLPI